MLHWLVFWNWQHSHKPLTRAFPNRSQSQTTDLSFPQQNTQSQTTDHSFPQQITQSQTTDHSFPQQITQSQSTDQSFPKQVQLFGPVVDTWLDGAHVPRWCNGGHVDVAVIKQLLNVISTTKNVDVLGVLVRQHNELGGLPCILHLQKSKIHHSFSLCFTTHTSGECLGQSYRAWEKGWSKQKLFFFLGGGGCNKWQETWHHFQVAIRSHHKQSHMQNMNLLSAKISQPRDNLTSVLCFMINRLRYMSHPCFISNNLLVSQLVFWALNHEGLY